MKFLLHYQGAKWYNSNRWQRTAFEHLFPAIQFLVFPRGLPGDPQRNFPWFHATEIKRGNGKSPIPRGLSKGNSSLNTTNGWFSTPMFDSMKTVENHVGRFDVRAKLWTQPDRQEKSLKSWIQHRSCPDWVGTGATILLRMNWSPWKIAAMLAWPNSRTRYVGPSVRKDPRDRAVTATRQNGHFLALHHRSCLLKSLLASMGLGKSTANNGSFYGSCPPIGWGFLYILP